MPVLLSFQIFPLLTTMTIYSVSAASDPWYSRVPHSRKSCDTTVNAFGKAFINVLRSSSMVLLNGRATGDETGVITCRSTKYCDAPNAGSVVDIASVSFELYSCVSSFHVCHDVHSGCHFPCCLSIAFPIKNEHDRSGPKKVKVLRPSGFIAQHYQIYLASRHHR